MTETNGTNGDNRTVGAFVTNKWLVGVLLLLTMSMGGYIFRGIDKSGDAQASTLVSLERRVALNEIEVAASRATQTAQYSEILRRLDSMERYVYSRPPAR